MFSLFFCLGHSKFKCWWNKSDVQRVNFCEIWTVFGNFISFRNRSSGDNSNMRSCGKQIVFLVNFDRFFVQFWTCVLISFVCFCFIFSTLREFFLARLLTLTLSLSTISQFIYYHYDNFFSLREFDSKILLLIAIVYKYVSMTL